MPRVGRIEMSAPEIHHRFAVNDDRHRRADVGVAIQTGGERIAYRFEGGFDRAPKWACCRRFSRNPEQALACPPSLRVYLDVEPRADADLPAEGHLSASLPGRVRLSKPDTRIQVPQFPNPRAPPEIHDAIGQINGGRIPAGRNHPA